MKSLAANNSGKKFVLENCHQVSVNSVISKMKKQIAEEVGNADICILGQQIRFVSARTGEKGKRYWFSCPVCNKRVGTVFKHPISDVIGCRNCLNLEYRSRLKKGMLEDIVMDKSGQ